MQNSWSSWPTRYVQKLVQGQLGACIKLAIIRPARYVHESWLSYDQLGTCKTAGPLGQLGTCIKLAVIRPARYVRESWLFYDQLGTSRTDGRLDQLGACKKVGPGPTRCVHKVGSYQTSLVRARKLVILRPAWYVQNSWSLGQLGACIKLAVIRPARYVRESWLWPAWYVQNSWSSWPTRYVQKSWSRAHSVRA